MNRISERIEIAACLGFALLIFLSISKAKGANGDESKLLELAKKKFPTFTEFTEAEKKMFKAVEKGEIADCSDSEEENNDPNNAKDWDQNKRAIRAELIAWLCTNPEASAMVTHKGVRIKGVCIDGELDLSFAKISFPLYFKKSAFPKEIFLSRAIINTLGFEGTHTGPISAYGLKVDGDIFLNDGFKAVGEVDLKGVTLNGNLNCINGQFINKDGKALDADALKTSGSIFLRNGFKAEGEVCMTYAKVDGTLDFSNGEFINKNSIALNAAKSNVNGGIYLRNGFKAEGEINLIGVTIGGSLECDKSQFINKEAKALNIAEANIGDSIYLREGFKAVGEVNLIGATLRGSLDCSNSKFLNKDKVALSADSVEVGRNVYLCEDFQAEGEVNFIGAILGGDLDCSKGKFINPNGYALDARTMKVMGDVNLSNNFRAEGEVCLKNAKIGCGLHCEKSIFLNPGKAALQADGMNVTGSVFLRNGFRAKGSVDLTAATVGLYLILEDVNSPEDMSLGLWSARIGTLQDKARSWPSKGNLYLHGLIYDTIHDDAPRDAKSRIDWLRRQPIFRPQPYEQLAAVLRNNGQDEDAREVLIAKNEDRAHLAKLMTLSEKCWYSVIGPMIGYGYRPLNVLWGVAVFIVLGCILFGIGYHCGLISPERDSAYNGTNSGLVKDYVEPRKLSKLYPRFNLFIYSVDTFVPLIDIYQAKYWLPNAGRGSELLNIKGLSLHTGGLLRLYLWIHLTVGWILTTLLVVGLTGLIRT